MKYVVGGIVCGVVCVGAAVVGLMMLGIYAMYSASVFMDSDHI